MRKIKKGLLRFPSPLCRPCGTSWCWKKPFWSLERCGLLQLSNRLIEIRLNLINYFWTIDLTRPVSRGISFFEAFCHALDLARVDRSDWLGLGAKTGGKEVMVRADRTDIQEIGVCILLGGSACLNHLMNSRIDILAGLKPQWTDKLPRGSWWTGEAIATVITRCLVLVPPPNGVNNWQLQLIPLNSNQLRTQQTTCWLLQPRLPSRTSLPSCTCIVV